MLRYKTLTLSMLMLTATPVALAQPDPAGKYGSPEPPSMNQQAPTPQVSESQLALYVKVSDKVEDIRSDAREDMQGVETAEEAQQIQNSAMKEMVSAVESFGMTTDEYNRITNQLQSDPGLKERYRKAQ